MNKPLLRSTDVARRMHKKKRVMIISTYKISCGIAEYTETVESLLRDHYEIEIGVLDQFLLKSTEPHLEKAGDQLIDAITEQARSVDVVNLQWEYGQLGESRRQILRRFKKILDASPSLVVTVHTVPVVPAIPPTTTLIINCLRILRRHGIFPVVQYIAGMLRHPSRELYRLLTIAARRQRLHLIVHTKRERRIFSEAIGIGNVHDHPLSIVRRGWEENLEAAAKRIRSELVTLYGERTFIGSFGFFSDYKGTLTAIEALRSLPDDYMLLLYGSVHPVSIRHGEVVSPYVEKLLNAINTSKTPSLVNRVQFLGAPDAFEFAAAMKACDINVFPYVEVGQSASGVASLSVELGKRTVISNNLMFAELERYFPNRTEKTDVGNHIQLAQAIVRAMDGPEPGMDGLTYNNITMTALYAQVFELASGNDGNEPVPDRPPRLSSSEAAPRCYETTTGNKA